MEQAARVAAKVGESVISQCRVFPGPVEIPPAPRGEERENMIEAAMARARFHEHDRDSLWTDGSRLDSGGSWRRCRLV